MMLDFNKMNALEVASFIATKLKDNNIDVVLSGGFCTQVYSKNEYISYDIDLVTRYSGNIKEIEAVMLSLGFNRKAGNLRYFSHPEFEYTVEFPSGPVAIGDSLIKEFAEIGTKAGTIKILRITDALKDRLIGWLIWEDESNLKQSLILANAEASNIDFKEVEEWAIKENAKRYEVFKSRLQVN